MIAKVALCLCLASAAYAGGRFGPGPFAGHGGFYAAAAAPKALVAEPFYAPQPYSFGYNTVDEYGNKQHRNEESDASNTKTGSYGYTDAHGIYRHVNYIADAHGFRATIDTNEPGTKAGASADAVYNAKPVVTGPVVKAAAAFVAPTYAKFGFPAHGHHGYGSRY
ncbi:cuticle protein 10.9-like [Ornithodoros turicata]|uniref:cuticle protein 10.9-like n=1 Tax=Ornithodoros turicata TaxID=34597 RepID=UPI003139F8B7